MIAMVSFVIPCYRSAATIEQVINDIVETMVAGMRDYEIICVNDGSQDDTLLVLERCAENNSYVKVINLTKNFGQHNALMAGLRESQGSIVVCLDDDGQTPPSSCLQLIEPLEEDMSIDVVYARYPAKQHSRFRNFGSQLAALMGHSMLGTPKGIEVNSYFACRRVIVDEIGKYESPYTFIPGLIMRTTRSIINVDVDHHEREVGKSGYSLRKLVALWLNGFTSFSVKPLRVASLLGFLCALLGFAFGIYVVINKVLNPAIPAGYSSIVAIVLFIGGMIMIMLGLLGEYVGRSYISINRAPQYVIKDTINVE